MVDTFVHRLAKKPTGGALFAGRTSHEPIPLMLAGTGNFLTKPRCHQGQFVEHCRQVAIVVAEPARPQVIERRLQRWPFLGTGAMQTNGVGEVDVAQMTDVLDH
ncbi:hypothetical protein MXEN_11121 [Mycobacterium xenopi RIVM700367]|nr:hypothetical protein MXEN_11121 [Mycobacterium xenopi RIVM700367]